MSTPVIVDSHCHFWDPARFHYAWNRGLPALDRTFLPAEFARASAAANVGKIIFVECDCAPAQSLAEADWAGRLAESEPRLKGIIARAPLEKGLAVRADLESLADRPLVKGVRRNLQDEPDNDFGLQSGFVDGVKLLAEFDFTFDLCIRHEQLASVTRLVRQVPRVTFVLDHFGKPGVRDKKTQPWASDLKAFAALPNTVCKISGLTTEADWQHWRADDLKYYFDQALECFGFGRLLFGSDWPMATLATNYGQWVETVRTFFGSATETERNQLFQTNSERIYRV